MEWKRGDLIAGKYRVERTIGQGGMGIVLSARHLGLDELVAVKLIRTERSEAASTLERFQREARAAARIKSEHVARVLDVDRLPDGSPYIVMELITGTDLQAFVDARGRLPADEAASYILQACEGIAEAHLLGMVHRDLKLKNLFRTERRDGRPLIKVIDFGVVKFGSTRDDPDTSAARESVRALRVRDVTLTGEAMLVGSVHYMAPEQILASSVVTAQADIWSLGVCLYTLVTGARPFSGETVAEVCAAIQGRPPEEPTRLAPDVPPGLGAVISRALEKDLRRRFANVAELAQALAPFAHDEGAAKRIATILDSGVRSAELAEPTTVPHGEEVASIAERRIRPRAESTKLEVAAPHASQDHDATVEAPRIVDDTVNATGSQALAPRPKTLGREGRWRGVTWAVVAASATTALVWRLSASATAPAAKTVLPAVSGAPAAHRAGTAAAASPAEQASAVVPSVGPTPSASSSVDTQRRPGPPVVKATPKPVTRPTSSAPPAASSPYDRF